MGNSSSSSYSERYQASQESYVERNINTVRSQLPAGKYSDRQIAGALRHEHNLSGTGRSRNNEYVLNRDWANTRRN